MKTEKYIVEIEMPDGDSASSTWISDVLQIDADVEDEGRWKVTAKEQEWILTKEQLDAFEMIYNWYNEFFPKHDSLTSLYDMLKKL